MGVFPSPPRVRPSRRSSEVPPVPADSALTEKLRRAGWLVGLPGLALIAAASVGFGQARVAAELREAAAGLVRETGEGVPEPWLRVEPQGRDLVALGEAPDAALRASVLARLAVLPGLRRLIDRTGLIEEASPFVWSLTREADGRIAASGSRPVEIGGHLLADRVIAELPRGTVLQDAAHAARGAPPDFVEAALFAARQVVKLEPGGRVRLGDTTLSIEGAAVDGAAYEALRATALTPPNGFGLGPLAIQPPRTDDFRLAVSRGAEGSLRLSGNVVSEAARTEILATAAQVAEGAPVTDETRAARGLPEGVDFSALARTLFDLATLLRQGEASFAQGRLSVEGVAIDGQAIGDVQKRLAEGLPAGLQAGSVRLSAQPVSPYRIRIRREAERVLVSGHFPDGQTRTVLLDALGARFFREAIVDRSRIAEGAPPNLLRTLKSAIDPLSTLAEGELALSDTALRLSGRSLYAQSARRIAETLPQALPAGWTASVAVDVADAPRRYDAATCARLFTERVSGHALRFAAGSVALERDFYPVLDALAELAKACPEERVEVAGHPDAPGTPPPSPQPLPEAKAAETKPDPKKAEAGKTTPGSKGVKDNKKAAEKKPEPAEPPVDLPRQRALAILDYLQKAGVPADRLVAASGAAPDGRQSVSLGLRS